MNRPAIRIVFVVALVAVAGCTGGVGGELGGDQTPDDSSELNTGTHDVDGETGTVSFYVSDEPNQIDDFEHLNVTITKIGFEQAKTENATETEIDETPPENETASENETDSSLEDRNETATEDGGWLEYEVDDESVDLTELQGANATALDDLDVPAGTYETVFLHVGEIEGILTDGTETNVKLPSEKLQVHSTFTVGAGAEIDFVFDIAPHKAGKSGKYVLKPVISQTGTGDEIEIRDVADDERTGGDDSPGLEGENSSAEADETDEADEAAEDEESAVDEEADEDGDASDGSPENRGNGNTGGTDDSTGSLAGTV